MLTPHLCRESAPVSRLATILWATVLFFAVSSVPTAAQTLHVGANFTTETYSSTTGEPPDTMGAVGPNHFVAFNNDTFAIFAKNGSLVSRVSPTSFWTSALGSNPGDVTDPRILYDPSSERWIAVMITTSQTTNNKILLARSNTADPTQGFKAVSYTTTNNRFADFPTLGIDANGVYVGTNNFTSSDAFSSVGLYSLPKEDLLGATPSLTRLSKFPSLSLSTYGDTLQPAVNYGPKAPNSATPVGAISSSSSTQYKLTSVSGTTGATATVATPVTRTVQSFSTPIASTQPGSSIKLDNGEDNISGNVVQVGDYLYAVQATAVSGRTAVRWTVANAATQTVAQQGTISSGTLSYFFPSIAVNDQGDVVIGFSGSGSTNFASTFAVVGASAGNVPGGTLTFGTPVQTKAGLAFYDGTRWGDYSATTPDPADPGVFWTHQEYAAARAGSGELWNWGTQATEVIPDKTNESRWSNLAGGSYFAGNNYAAATAPTPTSHVIFSRPGTSYQVSFPAPADADRASVRQGTVSWDLAGGSLELANAGAATPSLAVAEYQGSASLAIAGGTLNTVNTLIGGAAGGTGSLTVNPGGAWHNLGTVSVGPAGTGSLTINAGALADVGALAFGNQGTVNLNGGTLRVDGYSGGGVVAFAAGTLQLAGPRDLGTDAIIGDFLGVVPTIAAGKSLIVEGDATLGAEGSMSLAGGTLVAPSLNLAGQVTGFGTINVGDPLHPLANNGVIAGDASPSSLTLSGFATGAGSFDNVTFVGEFSPGNGIGDNVLGSVEFAGTLDVELGGLVPGVEFDQLNHSLGAATADLGGILSVTLVDGFTPAAGASFQILSAVGGVAGTFASVSLPALADGLSWGIDYGTNDVTLSVLAANQPGDFNSDNQIDDADLALWQLGFGTQPDASILDGDANADGSVDGVDFLLWQRNYVAAAPLGVVAEPAAVRLVAFVVITAACCARTPRRRQPAFAPLQ